MGFKPRKCLKRYYHVRPCQFLFPEETVVQGSTTLFSALLQRCLAKDVVAICRYIPRKNTPPKFVALMPQVSESCSSEFPRVNTWFFCLTAKISCKRCGCHLSLHSQKEYSSQICGSYAPDKCFVPIRVFTCRYAVFCLTTKNVM